MSSGKWMALRHPSRRAPGDSGFQQHTFTDEGADADVCVDPTGKWLLYSSTRNSEHPYIYMQRVDGTSVIELTGDAGGDAYPCFSPDGKQIAFSSTRSGPWQIYLMDTDGRNVVQVTNGTMQCVHPSFSPDGTRLVYAAIGSKSNQWELWTVNLSTNEKRMIGYGLFPRWSPDKSVTASRSNGRRAAGEPMVQPLDPGPDRRRRPSADRNHCQLQCGRLSRRHGTRTEAADVRDDRRAVAAPARQATACAAPAAVPPPNRPRHGRQDIWTINADGSNRQRLTDGNGTNLSPWWSPDNRVYFISDRGGAECVWSVRADPARERRRSRAKSPVPSGRGADYPVPARPQHDPKVDGDGPGNSTQQTRFKEEAMNKRRKHSGKYGDAAGRSPPHASPADACRRRRNRDRNAPDSPRQPGGSLGDCAGDQSERPARGRPAPAVGHPLPAVAGGPRVDRGPRGQGRRGVRGIEDPEGAVTRTSLPGLRGAGLRCTGGADGHRLRPVRSAQVRWLAGGVPPPATHRRCRMSTRATWPALRRCRRRTRRRPSPATPMSPRPSACSTPTTGASATPCSATPRGATTPSGRWASGEYLVSMDRYTGFAYHTLIEQLLRTPGRPSKASVG